MPSLLFRRILPRPWKREWDSVHPIIYLQNNAKLSSVVGVLDSRTTILPQEGPKESRRMLEISIWWEEPVLPVNVDCLLPMFVDNTKLQLRRLRCTAGSLSLKLYHLLPAYYLLGRTSLTYRYPIYRTAGSRPFDPAGSASTTWEKSLRKISRPILSPCLSLQLPATLSTDMYYGSSFSRLVGQQPVALHANVHLARAASIRREQAVYHLHRSLHHFVTCDTSAGF